MRSMVLLVVGMFVACGPSSAEIKMAKTASYAGDPNEMFQVIQQTTAATYKIAGAQRNADSGTYELMTEPQWYNPEGGRQSAGAGDFVQVSDRSVQLSLIVTLNALSQDRIMVEIVPKTFQHISGSPKPRELAPDDPNLPGWVQGRVETLYVEIHKSLQKYQVK